MPRSSAIIKPQAIVLLLLTSYVIKGQYLTRSGGPSVYYIQGDKPILMIRGATIVHSPLTLETSSLCACKTQCLTRRNCGAASYFESGSHRFCSLTGLPLSTVPLAENASSTLMIWQRIPNATHWLAVDRRVYLRFFPEAQVMQAKAMCERVPGFRLGIYTSHLSFRILKNFSTRAGTDVAIDLTTTRTGVQWGDGTPFDPIHLFSPLTLGTGSMPYYTLSGTTYRNQDGYGVATVLCQADPANNWVP